MPYIVTTSMASMRYSAAGKRILTPVSRRAVATLDEARRLALRTIDGHGARERDRRAACDLPESGGTILLPDGTVIEVEATEWMSLTNDLVLAHHARAGDVKAQQRILDAFNARP